MAGTRQYSRLLALFDNWDMYNDALTTSQTSMGALQQQQDIYAESMEAHLQKLSTSTEGFMDSLLDPEGLNPLIDVLSGIMSLLDNFTASIGGLGPMLLGFGGLATQVFSKHIANGLATMNRNIQAAKENTNTLTAYITVTNTGIKDTTFQWEILDYTNNDSIEEDNNYFGNTSNIAEILASGSGLEIKGNSSISFQQVITVTDELKDNPSSLLLSVTQGSTNSNLPDSSQEDNPHADDTDEIIFTAMESENCQKQTISWQAVNGADSYVLHYALEGDWDNCGIYVHNIKNTSYDLCVAPGEYAYKVIAIDKNGKAIGTWSKEEEIELLFHDVQNITITSGADSSEVFSLNDGIYNINGVNLENFTGTLTLFRNDLVKITEDSDSTTLMQVENDILMLTIVNGILKNPVSEFQLDHGDYFWKYESKTASITGTFDITLELSGRVFSIEEKDREIISIGDDCTQMPLVAGSYVETLEGEINFSNQDAIYQYMTDEQVELQQYLECNHRQSRLLTYHTLFVYFL
jgi:hypothetical protein